MDSGGVVLGWLVRLAAILGVVGVLAFDGISLGVARLSAADDASTAARVAGATWSQTGSIQAAYDTAVTSATEASPANSVPPSAFTVAPDGTVTLTVHRTAHTLVVRHVGWVRGWADVFEIGTAKETS